MAFHRERDVIRDAGVKVQVQNVPELGRERLKSIFPFDNRIIEFHKVQEDDSQKCSKKVKVEEQNGF